MNRYVRFFLIFLGLLFVLGVAARIYIRAEMGEDGWTFVTSMAKKRLGMEVEVRQDEFSSTAAVAELLPDSIEVDEQIVPFREIGATLGELGLRNNTVIIFNGVTIFDANGDGRLDLFVAHSGRPLAKVQDANYVLDTETTVPAKPCALFLNQGNNAQGDPIFTAVQDLLQQRNNGKRVREELLFENKYRPRRSINEDPHGVGRIARGALAADYNGDGRTDLLLLNDYFGAPFTKPGLGIRIYPANANLGRAARSDGEFIETILPPFLAGDLQQGHEVTLDYGEQPEREGRNTLLLNLGDRDGDGLPEWEDATERSGMTAAYPSAAGSVADIDRDGDLDVYVCNFHDPDFYGFGLQQFAGYRNELWINQLSETGEFSFREAALDYGVAGLHNEEQLPSSMWNQSEQRLETNSYQEWEGEQVGEQADHSWAAQLVDYNDDGYPDLIVANDLGNRLRVYENRQGTGFVADEQFHEAQWNGSWMGVASGDLDGDRHTDIMVANFGGNTIAVRNTAVFANDPKELNLNALSVLNYIEGKYTGHHALLSYVPGRGLVDRVTDTHIEHSPYLRPDATLRANVAPQAHGVFDRFHYDRSIAGLEFAWNPVFFDLENDGDLDVYMVGSLARGNDGFIGDWTAGPGRLLVNQTTTPGSFHFKDKTLDYHLLDIADMNYAANPPRRASPGTGWHKKDYVNVFDQDSYTGMGIEATRNSKVKDLFRLHENANGVYAADLNGDGFDDLVVPHTGGYNSTRSSARNLKISFAGKNLAVPAPNKVIKAPTNFEEGHTAMYINQGAASSSEGNWIRLQLRDEDSHNLHSIGAKVVVNDRLLRRVTVGGQSYGAVTSDLIIGLGNESLKKLEIYWPTGDQRPQVLELEEPLRNQTLVVRRGVAL